MFEGIPQKILNLWPLYFAIETPGSEARSKYEQLYYHELGGRSFSSDIAPNSGMSATILNPRESFRVTVSASQELRATVNALYYRPPLTEEENNLAVFHATAKVDFDYRILDVSISMRGANRDPIESSWKQRSQFGSVEQARVTFTVYGIVNVNVIAKTFSGLRSLLALNENGISIENFDAPTARVVIAYIEGVKKFGSEIQLQNENIEQEQRFKTAELAQDLNDKFNRDRAALQQQMLSVKLAVDNEANSAKRDIQNLILNAAGLKI